MSRLLTTIITFIAISATLLIVTSTFAAAAGGSRRSHASEFGGRFGASPFAAWRRNNHIAHPRRHGTRPGARSRHITAGSAAIDAASYEGQQSFEPACRLERVQISDDWGWRVRDILVCPQ
jgi:hypothetical protein